MLCQSLPRILHTLFTTALWAHVSRPMQPAATRFYPSVHNKGDSEMRRTVEVGPWAGILNCFRQESCDAYQPVDRSLQRGGELMNAPSMFWRRGLYALRSRNFGTKKNI